MKCFAYAGILMADVHTVYFVLIESTKTSCEMGCCMNTHS